MAQVTQEMLRPRYQHKQESVTSVSKYFPSIGVGMAIAQSESTGWELVSVVIDPGNSDLGICTALLYFKRPIAAPFAEKAHRDELDLKRGE